MKIFVIMLVVIVVLLLVAYLLIGNYFYNLALNPNTSKEFVLGLITEETQEEKERRLENEEWLNNNSNNIYITTNNNGKLKLHAYEILNPKKSNIWAIIVHGYTGQGKDMIGFTKEYYNRGYNILTLDLRGHGRSEGDYIGMGWNDRLDLIDWCNYVISKNSDSKIILHGVSMGAATVMMATGEQLPENVKIAIEDCGYTSIWDEFEMQLKHLFNLPTFPVLNAASAVCKIRAGYMLEEGSSLEQVKKSKTPTLFIHGEEDLFVPFNMLDKLYEAASCKKQKLVIENAAHAQSSWVNSELYWKTIDEFISQNID